MRRINSISNFGNNQNEQFSRTFTNFHKNNNRINTEATQNEKPYAKYKIKKPTAGIPIESIKSNYELPKDFFCSICQNLIWRPVEIIGCTHIFCKFCINKWITQKNICPTCKTNITTEIRPSKAFERIFESIKVKCNNNGCKETPVYTNYIQHLEKCKFQKYKCTNEGCNFKGVRDEVINHCLNCEFRITSCKYCKNQVKFNELEKHEKTECKSDFECPECYSKMTRGYYFSKHYDSIGCLKLKVKYYMNKCEKLEQKYRVDMIIKDNEKKAIVDFNEKKIKKCNEVINNLEKEKDNLIKEKKNLKEELTKIKNIFKKSYDQINK